MVGRIKDKNETVESEVFMFSRKGSDPEVVAVTSFTVQPKLFVFFDKSGTKRFEVVATADGRMPLEHAVGLLAMHCFASDQLPKDFSVMVAAGEDLLGGLILGAERLIESGSVAGASVQLTRRQQEVLTEVVQNLSNKEIAGRLNISERTVKFHVSALLEKFHVESRICLVLEFGGKLFRSDLISPGRTSLSKDFTALDSVFRRLG
jgi:DNA-binding CsgD family transcriptional regulator